MSNLEGKLDLVDNPDGHFEPGSYYKQFKGELWLTRLIDNVKIDAGSVPTMYCLGYTKVQRTKEHSLYPVFLTEKGICSWGTDKPVFGYRFIKLGPKI